MNVRHNRLPLALLLASCLTGLARADAPEEAAVRKAVIRATPGGTNLLKPDGWGGFDRGFKVVGRTFVCDNGTDARARRGVSQTVVLNQSTPAPIVATAWSKAEGVGGSADADYALYLDLTYQDGTPLWGQVATFEAGDHDWQEARVQVVPDRPVRSVTVNLLLRSHTGRALFRDATLHTVTAAGGATVFDGVPVMLRGGPVEGFQVRDVAAGGDFVSIRHQAAGLELESKSVASSVPGAEFLDVTLRDTTGKDRALTLAYSLPVPPTGLKWLENPRHATAVEPGREYVFAGQFRAGSSGLLSRYPFGAVEAPSGGRALGIDMAYPAFYRVGYNAGTGELYLACDLALTPETPRARLRLVRYGFAPGGGFRAALDAYYRQFPEAFRVRVTSQGQWMPFARISLLKDPGDFGFRFKEGNDETDWDDAHGVLTFRYTEPLTWWMPMKRDTPRTVDAAMGEARKLAAGGRREALALLTSGYHNAGGRPALMFLDTPWNNGAVWSMNSMPGIPGKVNDFTTKWNPDLRARLYGPGRRGRGELDGEYVDSSEGYVTDELDFRREHFAAARTPLVFSQGGHRPAIFRGLIAFEYVRGIERDLHAMNRLMMANSTPDRLCWLAPLLDVMGTETDWNPRNRWSPMSDAEMLYRRAVCKGKPFCFLMNTDFEHFSHDLVEKYMKRALAYGMFPGFFSADASTGHYFTRPELFERDRPLFKTYVPLCRTVAEAGWEPLTGAVSSEEAVHVERFGKGDTGPAYLTVFNDGPTRRATTLRLDTPLARAPRSLLPGQTIRWQADTIDLTLGAEDVAVIELPR